MKIWAKTEEFSEGKYLIVRRDGTTPEWPHFVIGGDDPCAPNTLRAYADEAHRRGFDPAYVDSVHDLADDFERRTGGKADPDAGPHRTDLPEAIAMMRRETSVAEIVVKMGLIKAALDDLITAIDQCGSYVDLEGGQSGFGPVVQACEVLGRDVPPKLAAWLAEDGDEDEGVADEDDGA